MMQHIQSNNSLFRFSRDRSYKGESDQWFLVVEEFQRCCQLSGGYDLTDHDEIDKKLKEKDPGDLTQKRMKWLDKNPLASYVFRDNQKNLEKLVEKLSTQYIKGLAILIEWIEPNLLMSVKSEISIELLKITNPYKVDSLVEFRATYNVLERKCLPDVSVSVQKSKSKFFDLPKSTAIREIVTAIKTHEYELSRLPVLDANGKKQYDGNGKVIKHVMDEIFMYTRLCFLMNDMNNMEKFGVFTSFLSSDESKNLNHFMKRFNDI